VTSAADAFEAQGAVTVAYIGKKDTNLFPSLMGAE